MTVQLFSGGMDSLCLWLLCGQPTPVYVKVGAPYEAAELLVLGRLMHQLEGFDPVILDGPPIALRPDPGTGHIPHRNLVLIVTAAAALDPDVIITGALLGEASPDKSASFHRRAGHALTASERRPVRVVAPAHRWTKTGLLARTLARFPAHAAAIATTRSCYVPSGPPCDRCPACFRRAVAEYHVGIRADRPRLPTGATVGGGWAAMRGAGVSRWPAVAVNNVTAAAALAGHRMRPRRRV